MLLCTPQTADLAPSLLAGLGEGSACGQGAGSRGEQGKANHREEKTRVPSLGQSEGSSPLLPNVTLSSLRVIFPFASNQITFLKTQQRPRKETFPLMEKPSVVQGRIW